MLRVRSRAIARFQKKGNVEIRRLWVKKWAAEPVRKQLGIPGCRALIRQDKEVRRARKVLFEETRTAPFWANAPKNDFPPSERLTTATVSVPMTSQSA